MRRLLMLLTLLALLTACTSTRPGDYTRQSDQDIIQALHNPASQPRASWNPVSTNIISDSMLSVGGQGFAIDQASPDNAYHNAGERIAKDPKPYFVMLTSNDSRLVLTALCLFHNQLMRDRNEQKSNPLDIDLMATAF